VEILCQICHQSRAVADRAKIIQYQSNRTFLLILQILFHLIMTMAMRHYVALKIIVLKSFGLTRYFIFLSFIQSLTRNYRGQGFILEHCPKKAHLLVDIQVHRVNSNKGT